MLIKQSSTSHVLVFLLVDDTDHITGVTGLSPTVTLSKAGGAFASPAGAVTEIANGWYQVAGNATDTNTLGPLILHATGTGADPVDMLYEVVAFDPQNSVRLGLTALPNAAADAAGGLPISDAGGLDLDARLDAAISSRQVAIWAAANSTVNLSATTIATVTNMVSANVIQVSGDATAADTLELFAEALDQSTGQLDSGSLANGTITSASIASGAITASTFAAGAITAAAIATDAIGSDELADGAVSKILAAFTIDGQTFLQGMKNIHSVILGETVVTGSDVEFLAIDGTTTVVTITYGGAGERDNVVIA